MLLKKPNGFIFVMLVLYLVSMSLLFILYTFFCYYYR